MKLLTRKVLSFSFFLPLFFFFFSFLNLVLCLSHVMMRHFLNVEKTAFFGGFKYVEIAMCCCRSGWSQFYCLEITETFGDRSNHTEKYLSKHQQHFKRNSTQTFFSLNATHDCFISCKNMLEIIANYGNF